MNQKIIALFFALTSLSACVQPQTQAQAPLTPHSVQQAKVLARSAQIHTVLMTVTGNEIQASRDVSSETPAEEPGDGDSIAMGSSF